MIKVTLRHITNGHHPENKPYKIESIQGAVTVDTYGAQVNTHRAGDYLTELGAQALKAEPNLRVTVRA